jgi:hypothetical protein
MLKQTRQADVQLFAKLAKLPADVKGEDVPLKVLLPAGPEPDAPQADAERGTPWLDKYGRDLTADAKAGAKQVARQRGIARPTAAQLYRLAEGIRRSGLCAAGLAAKKKPAAPSGQRCPAAVKVECRGLPLAGFKR